ncbi:hypothetical protein HMPREF3218_0201863 [Prevotella bivia]|nr:hypothetical protein HMPREF3218_0201863 [Prevotella bivia]
MEYSFICCFDRQTTFFLIVKDYFLWNDAKWLRCCVFTLQAETNIVLI